MKNLLHIFKILFIFALPITAENLYENLNADQLKRLDYLSENIRCPKCSYGNINSSNAPISKDLKQEIANLIEEGFTNDGKVFNNLYTIVEIRFICLYLFLLNRLFHKV